MRPTILLMFQRMYKSSMTSPGDSVSNQEAGVLAEYVYTGYSYTRILGRSNC